MRRRSDEVLATPRLPGATSDGRSSAPEPDNASRSSAASTSPKPGSRVVRTGEVLDLLGVSRVTLWVWRRKGLFPAPHRFGPNTIGWPMDEIQRWMDSRPTA